MENFIIEKTIAVTSDTTAINLAYLLQDVYNSLKANNDPRANWLMDRFVEELEELD